MASSPDASPQILKSSAAAKSGQRAEAKQEKAKSHNSERTCCHGGSSLGVRRHPKQAVDQSRLRGCRSASGIPRPRIRRSRCAWRPAIRAAPAGAGLASSNTRRPGILIGRGRPAPALVKFTIDRCHGCFLSVPIPPSIYRNSDTRVGQNQEIALLTGSCLCGSVAYEVDGAAGPIVHCHCQTCRKAHGTAFSSVSPVPRDKFRWTKGEELLSSATIQRRENYGASAPDAGRKSLPNAWRNNSHASRNCQTAGS